MHWNSWNCLRTRKQLLRKTSEGNTESLFCHVKMKNYNNILFQKSFGDNLEVEEQWKRGILPVT